MDKPTLRAIHTLILARATELHGRMPRESYKDLTVHDMVDQTKESGRVLGLIDACDIIMGEILKPDEINPAPCPNCKSQDRCVIETTTGLDVHCHECGHVQVIMRPESEGENEIPISRK